MENKKDWICDRPFKFAEMFTNATHMCCPQWLENGDIGKPDEIEVNWKSAKANDIRQSILDGSYSYCNENTCPKLTDLKRGITDSFIHKSAFAEYSKKYIREFPTELRYSFDQSCNLKCPSCRVDFVNLTGDKLTRAQKLIEHIESTLGPELTSIDCTGSGDPFFSKTFRKWLMTFDPTRYPKLQRIHLHSNGTLWNESNWSRMKSIHKLVKSCEISVDAATKTTYENNTRLGGKWEDIINNLNYIATLPYLEKVIVSFVVQESNFLEMKLFYDLVNSIFGDTEKNWKIVYNRVSNWGTFTSEKFTEVDVASPTHARALEFRQAFNSLPDTPRIQHNLPLTNEGTNNIG